MTQAIANQQILTRRLARIERKRDWLSRLIVLPAVLFLTFFFLIPLADILCKSVINPEIHKNLPNTLVALKTWDGKSEPNEAIFQALVTDLRNARQAGVAGSIGRRLGYEDEKYRVMLSATLRRLPPANAADVKAQVISASALWREPSTWQTIQQNAGALTSLYILAVFDHKLDPISGKIISVPAQQAEYLNVLGRTLWMSFIITLCCVAIGYPLAFWLACQPIKRANLLVILVLLPFWTSLLVRTTGWFILLQNNGVINYLLLSLHFIEKPLSLVPGRFGVYIAMVHILLPFIVLPLYAVMRGILPTHLRAAISLGAHPFYAFLTVYLPQTYAGLRAGVLLVFIMAIGYYITPSLLGNPSDQMVSSSIAYSINTINNWGLAAALSLQLMIIVVLLSWVYSKVSYKKLNNKV